MSTISFLTFLFISNLFGNGNALSCADSQHDPPYISNIRLLSSTEDTLVVEVSNVNTYCKDLSIGTGEFSFPEQECWSRSRYQWREIYEDDNSSVTMTMIGNDSLIVEDDDDVCEVSTSAIPAFEFTVGGDKVVLDWDYDKYYIHPSYNAFFYSDTLQAAFIFTMDLTDYNCTSEMTVQDYIDEKFYTENGDLNVTSDGMAVIFIAFSDVDSIDTSEELVMGEDYVVDIKSWSEIYDPEEDLSKSDGSWYMNYDGEITFFYDEMRLLRLPALSCNPPYFIYEDADLFDLISGEDPWSYEILFAGNSVRYIDDRVPRAYGYNQHKVWWVEGDSTPNFNDVSFEESELLSWWTYMWVLVIVISCCCFCITVRCYYKKKGDRKRTQSLFYSDV